MLRENTSWLPAEETFIKVNIDASYSGNLAHGDTGMVIRNHNGELIRAQAIWYRYTQNARFMEALATRDCIRLAMDLGFRKVIIESDAQEVVRMIDVANFKRADIASICL